MRITPSWREKPPNHGGEGTQLFGARKGRKGALEEGWDVLQPFQVGTRRAEHPSGWAWELPPAPGPLGTSRLDFLGIGARARRRERGQL